VLWQSTSPISYKLAHCNFGNVVAILLAAFVDFSYQQIAALPALGGCCCSDFGNWVAQFIDFAGGELRKLI